VACASGAGAGAAVRRGAAARRREAVLHPNPAGRADHRATADIFGRVCGHADEVLDNIALFTEYWRSGAVWTGLASSPAGRPRPDRGPPLIYAGVFVLVPRARPPAAGTAAIVFWWLVEFLQLTGLPATLSAHSLIARLVLGVQFDAVDLAWYVIGVLPLVVLHVVVIRIAEGGT
jgi:hypothetical protein